MDKLNHPLARGASYLLIYLTALQPLHPAIASGINAANGNTQVHIKPGNVPVVNIATPNGAGISHNSYKDFNVGAPGAVLNNATQGGKTQLGVDIINGNPNLKGKAAHLIINEVTGGSRSELQGKLEVFGNKANVMIANPNGISCDGCGFINAPGVTLTTGKPQFDQQGALEALEVKKGAITIGGKGLDGNSADYVDIISRATELNGRINAKNLSLTQGANRVSFKDGTIKSITGEGAKPQLAVDTKALGGMYANKIRLVANESGVGVNLNNINSTQRDITLSANGKIALGNVRAQTDLNVSAREIVIPSNAAVRAERDMTLAAATLINNGNVTAHRDMRIFADSVSNIGDKAALHSNKNLWIQKDAQGNKAKLVDNRSARIQTNSGDLIIRTEKLNNAVKAIKDDLREITPTGATVVNKKLGWHQVYLGSQGEGVVHFEGEFDVGEPGHWFGDLDFKTLSSLNVGRKEYRVIQEGATPLISSGKSLYINATSLVNRLGTLWAGKDLILTGNTLLNDSRQEGVLNNYYLYPNSPELAALSPEPTSGSGGGGFLHIRNKVKFKHNGEGATWTMSRVRPATMTAGGNLVADFSQSLTIDRQSPYDFNAIGDVTIIERPEIISAKNILLRTKNAALADGMKASGNITLLVDDSAKLSGAVWTAGDAISLTVVNNLELWQSELKGQDITLISRNGEIKSHSSNWPKFFRTDGSRWQGSLAASRDLTLTAGQAITLYNTLMAPLSRNIAMTANGDISMVKSYTPQAFSRLGQSISATKRQEQFNNLLAGGQLNTSGSILLNSSAARLSLPGIKMNAGKDISLLSGADVDLNMPNIGEGIHELLPESRVSELRSQLNAGGNLLINAAHDIGLEGASLLANGTATLLAGRLIWLASKQYSNIDGNNDNNKDERHVTANLQGSKGLTLASNGDISAYGSHLSSNGKLTLTSGGNMRFEAVQNHTYREGNNEFTESVTQQGSELSAGGLITAISGGSILFQATKLVAKGTLDVAAKGGYLYAQAMEESNHYEKREVKRKWYGKKTEIKQIRHDVINKVTEFTAGGDINLLSRDDSTYEASKIATRNNARLTSTQGKVNFRAVKNTSFEQTVTSSKGFYITQSNRGYESNKWVLPSIYTGGKLTVDAAQGISADVKNNNAQILQNAVAALGNSPGTAWLKDLSTRKDVQWSVVKDAYDSWDYKSQHLNPAVAATIAIAVAAVTSGAGLAAAAGNGAIVATGATGSAASVVYGSAYAGMTSLASQVAVALVDNQGNLSKTLKALGSNETVKATVTAMAIGGALAGFDQVLDAKVPADKARLPALIKDEGWSKIAQRVAGQSIISSSLNTTINGGSFRDNLTNALLANIGGQLNAEGANLIGDNGQILGVPGKVLSHAVVAGVAAEIGRGDGKGAAAGALAAELAGVVINDNLVKSESWQEQQAQISRVAGAFAGALTTGKAAGANSGANAAEIVERFNRQLHLDELNAIKELAKGDKDKEARLLAASCRKVHCTSQESLNADERLQYEALMKKYPSTREEDGLLANFWVQKERQRTGNYPAHVGYDLDQLFTYTEGDQISDGQLFARNQWVENLSGMTGWSKESVAALGLTVSIASTFAGMGKAGVGNQYLSTKLVTPTAGWKSYLVNEKTIQQSAAFRKQVTELRAGLPSSPKRGGNMAVAEINISGMPKSLAAHSSLDLAGKGVVGKGSQNFIYQKIPNKEGREILRNTDSEYKILDNLADRLGNNTSAKGSVTLFTERPACGSCLGVIDQFQKKYPGIKVNVLDNNGVILKPGSKK